MQCGFVMTMHLPRFILLFWLLWFLLLYLLLWDHEHVGCKPHNEANQDC